MRRRTGTIETRKAGFRIRYTDLDGIRQSENYATREEAEFHLAQRLAELAHGVPVSSRPNTITFKELAADVVNNYKVNRYSSIEDLKDRFRCHLNPVFGNMKAARITTARIEAYQVTRLEEGAKPGTVNREMEAMRHTFRLAIKGRKLFTMPHVPMLKENNVRTGFFTREEVERLCSHLPKPLDSVVRFAFLTGWRLGEIRGLRWSNVDFVQGEIRLDPGTTKNREGRVFPMTGELRALLEAIRAADITANPAIQNVMKVRSMPTSADHIFRKNGRPIGDFRKRWLRACFKAGLPCVVSVEGKPLKAIRIFHDLRRSAAREMIRRGAPEGLVMALCGWKTRSVLDRYNIISAADLRAAVTFLEGPVVPGNVPGQGDGTRKS